MAEILRTMGGGRNLKALVGASGSGKSSPVRAGLIPALAKGAIEGSDRWLVASMMPGGSPVRGVGGGVVAHGDRCTGEPRRVQRAIRIRFALSLLCDDRVSAISAVGWDRVHDEIVEWV